MRSSTVRILIIDPHEDFRFVLEEAIQHAQHATRPVETRSIANVADLDAVKSWMPSVVLVATELLDDEMSVSSLRASLRSLEYVVGMADLPHLPTRRDCDRVVVKPFRVPGLLADIVTHVRLVTN